ncbi:hypothetical protein K4K59_005916 [Colletotrichum sp. SAR11_240]|nr:hypothetical protein K4K59_005916 [Colletotrichum sp. SAR11_240]
MANEKNSSRRKKLSAQVPEKSKKAKEKATVKIPKTNPPLSAAAAMKHGGPNRTLTASDLGLKGSFRDGPGGPRPKSHEQKLTMQDDASRPVPASANPVTFQRAGLPPHQSTTTRNAVDNPVGSTAALPAAAQGGNKRKVAQQEAVDNLMDQGPTVPVTARADKRRKVAQQDAVDNLIDQGPTVPVAARAGKPKAASQDDVLTNATLAAPVAAEAGEARNKRGTEVSHATSRATRAAPMETVLIDDSASESDSGDAPPPKRHRSKTQMPTNLPKHRRPDDDDHTSYVTSDSDDSDVSAQDVHQAPVDEEDALEEPDKDGALDQEVFETSVDPGQLHELPEQDDTLESVQHRRNVESGREHARQPRPIRGQARQTSCVHCLDTLDPDSGAFPLCHRNDATTAEGHPVSTRCFRCEKEDLHCDDVSEKTLQAAQDVVDQSGEGTDTWKKTRTFSRFSGLLQQDLNHAASVRLAESLPDMISLAPPVAPVAAGAGTDDSETTSNKRMVVHCGIDNAFLAANMTNMASFMERFCAQQFSIARYDSSSRKKIASSYEQMADAAPKIAKSLDNLTESSKKAQANLGLMADELMGSTSAINTLGTTLKEGFKSLQTALVGQGLQLGSLAARANEWAKVTEDMRSESRDGMTTLNSNLQAIQSQLGAINTAVDRTAAAAEGSVAAGASIAKSLESLVEIERSKRKSRERKAGGGNK